jgi:hypothetical protein
VAKILFVTLDLDKAVPFAGSKMIRVEWLLPHLPGAQIYDRTQNPEDFDAIVYSKFVFSDESKQLLEKFKHKIQILDLCDPEHFFRPNDLKSAIGRCRCITVSNDELKIEIEKFCGKPVYTIQDRVRLDDIKATRIHDNLGKPKLVWFGYGDNFQYVNYWRPELEQSGLELIVISDYSVSFGKFVRWDRNTFMDEIIKGDIVFNPKGPFKSENKTYLAWALGMPVAKKPCDIEKFLEVYARAEEGRKRKEEVKTLHSSYFSAWELDGIIQKHLREINNEG